MFSDDQMETKERNDLLAIDKNVVLFRTIILTNDCNNWMILCLYFREHDSITFDCTRTIERRIGYICHIQYFSFDFRLD